MEQDNKIIAEFMDLRSTGLSIYKPSEYKYHTSWDWLMPVVEKMNLQVTLGYATGNIHKLIDKIHHVVKYAMKDATYKAVVEFIKDYNNER